MKVDNLNNFFKGWIIGNFEPTLLKTTDFEVGIKKYKKGDKEDSHHHKISTEYTVIVDGNVKMNNIEYADGSIIIIEPSDRTDFEALTDVTTIVVKTPSSNNDKYID